MRNIKNNKTQVIKEINYLHWTFTLGAGEEGYSQWSLQALSFLFLKLPYNGTTIPMHREKR